ncbi:MAG: pyridoxamine 5'-phosphate oxidase family protein [Candidatus Thorarchaeota archaeon]
MAMPILGAATGVVEPEQEESRFDLVERKVRGKSFAVISTVDSKNRPHSTGVVFVMSPPEEELMLYVLTQSKSAKARNIKRNPNVSLVVTFPHYYLRFIPDSTVMFRGTADIVGIDDSGAQAAFAQIGRKLDADSEAFKGTVVIRIRPSKFVYVYGVGIGMNQMRKDPTSARYKVTIPPERLVEKSTLKEVI